MKRKPRNTRLQTLFEEGRPRDCRPNSARRKEQTLVDHGTVSNGSQVGASITVPTPHFHIRMQFPFDNILIDAHTRSKTDLEQYSRSTGYTDRNFDIPTGISDLCHAKEGYRQHDMVGGKVQEVE